MFEFEGKQISISEGDTIASALFRSGVRVFSRSFKYHRRRGLYCLTGDCPNCLLTVDGEPAVRACVTAAAPGQDVRREVGWPSADRDVFGVLDRMHRLLPVGFYYKSMLRPRWVWPRAEPWVRRMTGLGTIPRARTSVAREVRHLHPDVMVIGAGVAGLSAALAAAEAGRSVVICDEGHFGEKVAPGAVGQRIEVLAALARASEAITVLERAPAIGIYEGPLVVLNEPSFLHQVHPGLVVVATGAVEEHGVFPGNDLPGVWLGRGAVRLAGVHGIAPGDRVVVVGGTHEAAEHAETIRSVGADVTLVAGRVVAAKGRAALTGVVIERDGHREELDCDALVLAVGLVPRDGLALQGAGLPVVSVGDAATPGMTPADVEEQARRAIGGQPSTVQEAELPPAAEAGIVCLCEDVGVEDLAAAWKEGFRSTEILKRYTTATMGPCQGALCQRHVRAFVAARPGATGPASGRTTARPPTRGITLEEVSAGVRDELHQETALHRRHLELGATMEPAGAWQRPRHYGDVVAEYWAVRQGVSVMDVGTLGKFLVGGPDAPAFLERLYPCRVTDLQPGRIRYALLLGDHGFVVDDGVICALGGGRWYVTFTSAGASAAESTLRDWADTWGHEVHLVDLTAGHGAINIAGPQARELLRRVCGDPIDNAEFPYLNHREITVAGVPCRAIRLGFVGELSYELHHAGDRSVELWDALLEAGADLDIRPHGLDALRLLRLEKGHIIVGQDTDFDATPAKLNMSWAVRLDKPWFVGKRGIERAAAHEPLRRLAAMSFAGHAPAEGSPLRASGKNVGYLTSSGWSHVLDRGVALGWLEQENGDIPPELECDGTIGTVTHEPFYDPAGARLRA